MYFLAEPMESGTYLDDHILLYCVYRHESHMVVIVLPWWVTLWSVFELLSH